MADEFVYLKYVGRGGKTLSMHAEFGRPFLFEPYLRLPLATYAKWSNLINFSGEINMVPQDEYDAWAAKKAEAEAIVLRCGDFGGQTIDGKYCGKAVDAPGCRCEHHGGLDAELQGKYEKVELAEKPKVNRGGRPRKVKA